MKQFKKLGMLAILIGVASLFSGCLMYSFSKAATITIYVEDPGGNPVADEIVYMFSAASYSRSSAKSDAYQNLATNSKGSVEFSIKEIEMLYQDEASFVFVTYKGDQENGRASVTVKRHGHSSNTIHNSSY